MGTLRTQESDGVLVVYFSDTKILDEVRIQQISDELLEAASNAQSKKLLLNFNKVSFMSSAMIGKLIMLQKKCKAEEIELRLCSISPNVAEVFKIMGLKKVFDIQKDEEKAMKSFNKKGWFKD